MIQCIESQYIFQPLLAMKNVMKFLTTKTHRSESFGNISNLHAVMSKTARHHIDTR